MEHGQCSRSTDDDEIWAKLVPNDSTYQEIEIRSQDTIICSEVSDSSKEKFTWCEISWNSEHDSARIRNLSSNNILVDGAAIGEEALDIKSGSEITSGPHKQGFISYTFKVIPSQKHEERNLKLTLDVEHAKCSICLNIWHDVVTVAPCLHNFCNGCFSEWLRRSSTRAQDKSKSVLCPQCRTIVHSVGKNHFLQNIEEAILQTFSSLKRSDEEISQLDACASVKTNLVLGIKSQTSRKRRVSVLNSEGNAELPCPQCGTELGGFRCSRSTTHLQCQGCAGLMPSRSDINVPQLCLGCNRAFCAPYWRSLGVDANDYNIICDQQTFKPISERVISRIPDSVHQNNQYEKEVTEKCILLTGKTLQAVISEWIIKFNNREIDRSRLQLNRAETINSRTHTCKGQMGLSEEEQKKTQEVRLQPNGKNKQFITDEPVQEITNGNTNGCCQGDNKNISCQNCALAAKLDYNHTESENVVETKGKNESTGSARKLCGMPTWFETWERQDTYAALAVVTAAASIAVAYSCYRQSR